MQPITSPRNKRVAYVKALQSKARLRRGERRLVLEGSRLIKDALSRSGKPDLALYSPARADYDLIAALQERHCQLLPVSNDVLRHVSDTKQPPGLLAVFHLPMPPLPKSPSRVLILDSIREPGNMGLILRSATAAAVDIAILAPGCVDPYNPKVLRAGMGAHFRLPLFEAPWNEIRAYCSDRTTICAEPTAPIPYTEHDWTAPWALIVGSEAQGLSPHAHSIAQNSVSIPMAQDTESLNAAAAATVILFEAQRQRLHNLS